jgi:hypothetical protein
MGLSSSNTITVTTSSPNEALQRLFSYGEPSGKFFIPFSHTSRFFNMQPDAGRSVVQTTVKQWNDTTAVGTNPTSYLQITRGEQNAFVVRTSRRYPEGLGYGTNGFALTDDSRVSIPDLPFAIWYYRQQNLPEPFTPELLINQLKGDLNLEPAEMEAIFSPARDFPVNLQAQPLTDKELHNAVEDWMQGRETKEKIVKESQQKYSLRIQSTMSMIEVPQWLRVSPAEQLKSLLDSGSKAILLFGAPRTGKTHAIDLIIPRTDENRTTIQIHDGWGYDELMVSYRPKDAGGWDWERGELLEAIRNGKKFIVLEEINRTQASQALGEVFSLLEENYRGEANAIKLRNGDKFSISEDTVIIATMNTLDKSTEDLDDALLGRFAAVEYPPRVEDLISLLEHKQIPKAIIDKLAELFAAIQAYYPLGHGYFSQFNADSDVIAYYRARIRPVLQSHLSGYRDQELMNIDEKVDQLFFA